MKQYALTTVDNPYNPFDDFRKWWLFDVTHGYNTCDYLARVAPYDDHMVPEQELTATKEAIDEIIALDPFNIYVRVSRDVNENEFHT